MGQSCEQPAKKTSLPSASQISQFQEDNRSSPFERLQSSSAFKENVSRSRLQVRSSRLEAIPEHIDDGVRERLKDLPSLHRAARKTNNSKTIYISTLNADYEGEVEGDQPNGEGFLKFRNGDVLQGTFKDGVCEGRGRMIRTDGSYYEGEFRSNIANGYGTYIDKSGFSCSGQWRHNSLTGKGEASYPDGSRYNGDFLNNKRHGKGVLMLDGCIFEGDFENDYMSGLGTMRTDSGEYYSGQWRFNEKNGEGQYSWPNGNHYKGSYKDGFRDGFGKMIYGNGEEYKGHWAAGLKHGQGEYVSSRRVTKGQWQKGQFVRELERIIK